VFTARKLNIYLLVDTSASMACAAAAAEAGRWFGYAKKKSPRPFGYIAQEFDRAGGGRFTPQ
jgi:hypothetical protein